MIDNTTEAVLRTHDSYDKRAKEYQFFEEAYKGGREYIEGANLFKHGFEDADSFTNRKMRAYYYNYCAPIVNAYNSFIYRQEIQRDYGDLESDPLFALFKDNCDKRGTAYTDFFPALSKWASVSGLRFLLVDKPPQVAETKAGEIEGKLYPYFVHIDPQNVLDWSLDAFGNLKWIKIRESEADGDTFDAEGKDIEKYRIWYAEGWELWEIRKEGDEKKAFKTDEGEHPVGEVPVIPVVHVSEEPMCGFSLLNDIAYVNRSLYNWCSLLDELLYRQTFSQLIMPENPANPIGDVTLGTEKGLTYPYDAQHTPEFISPDASQAQVLITQIEKAVEEIYRLATLRGAIGVEEQSSGVARSYDFMITNNTLSDKAHNMESVETRALRIWAKWQEGANADPQVSIQYPLEFEISSLAEEIQNVISAQTLQISDRFEQVLKERLVKRMTPRLSKDDMLKIKQEIEAGPQNPQQDKRDALTNEVQNILGAGNGQGSMPNPDMMNQGGTQ